MPNATDIGEHVAAILARAEVILRSAVTWIMTASAILAFVATELAPQLGQDSALVRWLAAGAALLTGIVATIRRVTPVEPEQRGLLPTRSGPLSFPTSYRLDSTRSAAELEEWPSSAGPHPPTRPR